MAIKFKALLSTTCMLLFTVGFAISAYAFDCGRCHLSCAVDEYQCLQDGFSEHQCRTWYNGCIATRCNNCVIP